MKEVPEKFMFVNDEEAIAECKRLNDMMGLEDCKYADRDKIQCR